MIAPRMTPTTIPAIAPPERAAVVLVAGEATVIVEVTVKFVDGLTVTVVVAAPIGAFDERVKLTSLGTENLELDSKTMCDTSIYLHQLLRFDCTREPIFL